MLQRNRIADQKKITDQNNVVNIVQSCSCSDANILSSKLLCQCIYAFTYFKQESKVYELPTLKQLFGVKRLKNNAECRVATDIANDVF